MNDVSGYAVFFFPQALDALGEAVKPYLQDGAAGPHVVCNEIDTSGSLIEMTMRGATAEGKAVVLELMLPVSMVRMIVSSQSDGSFGFGPRLPAPSVQALPPVGPTAEPATAQPASVPAGGAGTAPAPAPAMGVDGSGGGEAAKPSP